MLMKTKSFFTYCLCSLLFCITSTAEIKPVIRKMTFKQADETLLHVNHVANSQYSFYTTTDGRVLLRDSVGNLCYAKQIGNQLINTGIAAHEEGWQSENERSVKRTAAKLSNVLNSLPAKGFFSQKRHKISRRTWTLRRELWRSYPKRRWLNHSFCLG